jgi:tRNA threonylcarbamoyladenosine biosynthesis protein TsaB
MWILTLETTGAITSVALINEKAEIKEKQGEERLNHLTSLIPMTKLLLEENALRPKDLSAIAASVGPGSFTGIRIGVSTARALSQSLEIPCLQIPTLQTFLYNGGNAIDQANQEKIIEKHDLKKDERFNLVCPILDARRDQLYGAVFYKGKALVEEGAYSINEFLDRIGNLDLSAGSEAIFYGDGISRYSDIITLWSQSQKLKVAFAPEEHRHQRASSGAVIAKAEWDKGKLLSYNHLVPEYMRISEAESRLKDGTLHV